MRIEYFPETDTLSVLFLAPGATATEGADTHDPDVTLLYDEANRIGEIVIEHASRRINLAELRRHVSFEEIRSAGEVPAPAPVDETG